MPLHLDDYRATLEGFDPHIRDSLTECFHEAARVMSPRGLRNYLEGARALADLGRGHGLVIAYLQSMPLVCKAVGDEIIPDAVPAVMKLGSKVSGAVLERLFDTLPIAARRLGDADLLRQYLSFLEQLAARAPRGLRPMLEHLDPLFEKLTLGGLRRWAMWGAQTHARDFDTQVHYFALETADSQAVLQKERRGTLFVDLQRRLNFYLRALWARDFPMRPTAGDFETRQGYRPYLESRILHLPDAYDDYGGVPGAELYRAAAAHAAAHLVYTPRPLSAEQLNPVQRFLIGLLEDARVERCAIRDFPGLRRLWLPLHEAVTANAEARDPAVRFLERLCHALLDPSLSVDDVLIRQTVEDFDARFESSAKDPRLSWDLGVQLYNRLGRQLRLPALRILESLQAPYRDDNRFVWAFDEAEWRETDYIAASQQTRRKVELMEFVNEVDCELAGDDAQEIWVLGSELFPYEDQGVSYNQMEGKEPVSEPWHYPEWDYQVQLHRPDWTTVLEKRQPLADPAEIDRILQEHRPLASQLERILDALQPQGVVRQRHQEDGEEIDLDAAIRALADLRMGQAPDTRVHIRTLRKTRDLSVLLLLDLSESTNETLGGSSKPVLQLAREATSLLAWAIARLGDPFAIHGFASDGRHDVQYYRFKDFDQPYDEHARARLAGMRGGLSTRMGAALRHAGRFLLQQPQQKKLVLLLSDGEPADIDERDPQYLRLDTRKAVEELALRGVMTYCLTLDPKADDYVGRIFGVNGYTVVDRVQSLPEKLPALFVRLTG